MNNKSVAFVVLTTGFALFSMFFGSGNLVFPLQVGRDSNGYIWSAATGLLITGVLVPALGTFVILLHKGCYKNLFNSMGCRAGSWFPLMALCLMGRFGVLPRCLTVAQGSFDRVVPGVSPYLFTFFSCLLIYMLNGGRRRVVSLIGSILTPLLLLSLAAIFFQGFSSSKEFVASSEGFSQLAFYNGFFQGYQTMDLLAAFFFSSFVIKSLEEQALLIGESAIKLFGYACTIGMGLLGAVYCALVFLGGTYRDALENVAPQQLLGAVAMKTLGSLGGPLVCLSVMLACLTTGIVLARLFSNYLQREVCQNKIGEHAAMKLTLLIAFSVSMFQFSGIAVFIGPLLELLYPALILMSFHLSLVKLGWMSHQRWLFPSVALFNAFFQLKLS